MASVAEDLYRTALGAWSTQDLDAACELAVGNRDMEVHATELLRHILELDGPRAAQMAVAAVLTGRALDRIADHAVIVGERLRYLLTGDPTFLASEIR
jgi:phosphate uptake regulator